MKINIKSARDLFVPKIKDIKKNQLFIYCSGESDFSSYERDDCSKSTVAFFLNFIQLNKYDRNSYYIFETRISISLKFMSKSNNMEIKKLNGIVEVINSVYYRQSFDITLLTIYRCNPSKNNIRFNNKSNKILPLISISDLRNSTNSELDVVEVSDCLLIEFFLSIQPLPKEINFVTLSDHNSKFIDDIYKTRSISCIQKI